MRVVIVPGALALLDQYAGEVDPVADLRDACLAATAWLGRGFGVHGSSQGLRIAAQLAAANDLIVDLVSERPAGIMVVANGSATRSEKAPGHFDSESAEFDDAVRQALSSASRALADLDRDTARRLWADVQSLVWLGRNIDLDPATVSLDYDADPFGVQYWVFRAEGVWRTEP